MTRRLGTILIWVNALGACAKVPPQTALMVGEVGPEYTTRALTLGAQDFGVHFLAVVDAAADSIWVVEPDVAAKAAAAKWRTGISPLVTRAVFQPDPMLSLGELWALAMRQRAFFETGAGRADFGVSQAVVVDAAIYLEEAAAEFAYLVMTRPEDFEANIVDWSETYPFTSYRFDTPSIAQAATGWLDEPLGVGVGAVADVALAVSALEQRVSFVMEDAPREVKWQASLAATTLVGSPGFKAAQARVDSLVQVVGTLEDAIERAVVVLEGAGDGISETLAAERRAVLSDMNRQREETLAALSVERMALLAAISAERIAVTRDLGEARLILREDAKVVVDSILIAAELRGRSLVDHIFWRALQLLAIGYVAIVLAVAGFRGMGRGRSA